MPNFDKVNVGDLIAPMRVRGTAEQWTGTLLKVTKVSAKRLCVGASQWIEKATGRPVGRGATGFYVPATKEMIAEIERKTQERSESDKRLSEFHARPEYKFATNIWIILDQMTPDNHPLDRLTLDEWAAFYNKLSGREPK